MNVRCESEVGRQSDEGNGQGEGGGERAGPGEDEGERGVDEGLEAQGGWEREIADERVAASAADAAAAATAPAPAPSLAFAALAPAAGLCQRLYRPHGQQARSPFHSFDLQCQTQVLQASSYHCQRAQ